MADQNKKGRKKVVVSLETKLNALQRLDKGEPLKKVASEIGVGETTVKDWKKNRQTLESYCGQIENTGTLKHRSTLRRPVLEEVDNALWLWFSQERRRGTPISGPILKEKALILNKKLKGDECFTASEGWLSRWKKRHGIHLLTISGEKLSADQAASSRFTEEFAAFVEAEGLGAEQLYNIDETGLNFKMLPEKTLASSSEASAPGLKKIKERLTVAVCSNATGTHKMPLFVIGKSAKPRAFKNVNPSSLPVYYQSQRSAWMDSKLFTDWFFSQFVPAVIRHLKSKKLPAKAVLLLDNAPTHPAQDALKKGNIFAKFLPPNVTSLIQPMDQGVIECLKRRYRRKLLSSILEKIEIENLDLKGALKAINIKDVIYMLSRAWEEIPNSTVSRSWRKLWKDIEADDDCENEFPVVRVETETVSGIIEGFKELGCPIDENDAEQWINCDSELESEFLADEEVIQAVLSAGDASSASHFQDEEDDLPEPEQKIAHATGKEALDTALRYVEQQETSTCYDVLLLRKWRDYAAEKRIAKRKQMHITDFFISE